MVPNPLPVTHQEDQETVRSLNGNPILSEKTAGFKPKGFTTYQPIESEHVTVIAGSYAALVMNYTLKSPAIDETFFLGAYHKKAASWNQKGAFT